MQIISVIRTVLLAAIIAMGVGGVAVAGPFEDATAAYERQDYATAMRPLAASRRAGRCRCSVHSRLHVQQR